MIVNKKLSTSSIQNKKKISSRKLKHPDVQKRKRPLYPIKAAVLMKMTYAKWSSAVSDISIGTTAQQQQKHPMLHSSADTLRKWTI